MSNRRRLFLLKSWCILRRNWVLTRTKSNWWLRVIKKNTKNWRREVSVPSFWMYSHQRGYDHHRKWRMKSLNCNIWMNTMPNIPIFAIIWIGCVIFLGEFSVRINWIWRRLAPFWMKTTMDWRYNRLIPLSWRVGRQAAHLGVHCGGQVTRSSNRKGLVSSGSSRCGQDLHCQVRRKSVRPRVLSVLCWRTDGHQSNQRSSPNVYR